MSIITREKLTSSNGAIRLERHQQGCGMWGILHVLKYNRWRYATKRLLPKRLHHIKHSHSSSGKTFGDWDPPDLRIESREEPMKKPNSPSEDNDGFSPVIVPIIKDRTNNNNWVGIKRFKSIGHKIKHLMAFDKNEKRRIAMDGVLDKIPKDQKGSSDEVKKEVVQKWKNSTIKNSNRFKWAPSMNESMDKYRKLFWSSNNDAAKRDSSYGDGLKLTRQKTTSLPDEGEKRSLGRILSLPNFGSYSLRGEDSVNSKSGYRASSVDSKSCAEFKLGLGFHRLLEVYEESETKDDVSKDVELLGSTDSEEEEERVDPTNDEITVEPSVVSSSSTEELDMDAEEEMIVNYEGLSIPKDMEFGSGTFEIDAPDSKLTTDTEDAPDSKLTTDPEPEDLGEPEALRSQVGDSIQVKPRDLELFNYVRDVLEVSGFGVRPSKDRTLDPSMYEEVEGHNLLKKPKCGDHLHIFDLMNEVLLDIHQRTVSYWPRPLTSHCHVRPVPSGHHILKQVWGTISSYLTLTLDDHDPTLDSLIRRELEKRDGWMNLQFEGECAGLELEESTFEDLLDELMFDDLLEELMWF